MRLALYRPDIHTNVAALMRHCACLGVPLDIIGPTGFEWDEARVRRVVMDYEQHLEYVRHESWEAFVAQKGNARLVLFTTKATMSYTDFAYRPDDILLMGRESAGVPPSVHNSVEARVTIPMREGPRSLNLAMAAAMAVGEGLRQISLTCGAHQP